MTPLLTLHLLRRRRGHTQVQLAEALSSTQSAVSRLERQGDMLVSTLADYVAATGGTLHLLAQYPDEQCEVVFDLPSGRDRHRTAGPAPLD